MIQSSRHLPLRATLGFLVITLASMALAQPATLIELEVTDGPLAGHYEATSDDFTCSYGLAFGEDAWGNQYSITTTDPATFSSLQLVVPSTTDAADGTDEFLTTISFGEIFGSSGTSYTIDTREGRADQGEGTVTVEDTGDTAVVLITGTTEDGIGIDATITCHEVYRVTSTGESDDSEASVPTGSVSLTIADEAFDFQTTDDEAGCSEAYFEEGDFYYSLYRETDSEEDLSNLELLLPDFTAARSGSAEFYLSINDQSYYLDTTAGSDDGSGTVSVQQDGEVFIITLDVATADGVPIQGTLRCTLWE